MFINENKSNSEPENGSLIINLIYKDMDCTIKYSSNETIHKAIAKLAGDNRSFGLRLASLVDNPNFDGYLTRRGYAGVDRSTMDIDVLSNLISDYYKTQILDPARTTRVTNTSTVSGFVDNNVLNDCRNYFADMISSYSYTLLSRGDKRGRDWKFLLDAFYRNVNREIHKRAIEVLGEEYAKEFDAITESIGIYTALNDAATRLRELRNNSDKGGINCERNANFADLFFNIKTSKFIDYVKGHSKISRIFKDIREEDVDNAIEEYENLLDDDSVETSNSNEEGNNTGQWNWGDNITDYKSLISGTVKSYFDSLYVLQSAEVTTENEQFKYDIAHDNSIGTPRTMSYQEASAELFTLAQNPDAKLSPEKFLESIRYVARVKKNFASFIKLYNDMIDENGQLNSFGRRIYSEFVKPIVDVAVTNVDTDGAVEVSQSNNDNNPRRTFYYQLYNDLKATTRSSLIYTVNDIIDDLERIDTKIGSFAESDLVAKAIFDRRVNERINAIKFIYKTIFPSIDVEAIDGYIEKNKTVTPNKRINTINNLNSLLEDIKSLAPKLIDSNDQYNYDFNYNQGVSRRNSAIERSNQQLAETGNSRLKPKEKLAYRSTDYCSNLYADLHPIVAKLNPYTNTPISLNYHDVNGHNVSSVQYNNYISNTISIFKSKESATAKMEDLMRTNEYQYSNILVDDPEHGVFGLFRKINGSWQLSPYFDRIINSYFMGGINNRNTGKSSTYANMSDSDYFYYNYMLFTRGIRDYSQYNVDEQDRNQIRTAPMLLTIPSDAPKNYIYEIPVYNSRELFGLTKENVEQQVKDRLDFYNTKIENLTGFQPNVRGLAFGYSVSTEAALIDILETLLNGNNGVKYKTTLNNVLIPNGVTNIRDLKAGTIGHFVIKYISPTDNVTYRFIFSGTIANNFGNLGIEFEPDGIEYKGFLAKSDNLNSDILNVFNTYLTKEYNKKVNPVAQIDANNQSAMATQLRNVIYGEIQSACHHRQFFNENGEPILDESEYFDYLHKNKGKFIDENKEFVGHIFHYHKLHNIIDENGNTVIDVDKELQQIVHISSTGGLNINYRSDNAGNTFINLNDDIKQQIDQFITKWVDAFYKHTVGRIYNRYASLYNNDPHEANHIDYMTLFDMMMNATLFDIKMDDLSHGDTAFYKDVQTYVKRSKEEQAGGILSSGANFGYQEVGNTRVNSFIPTAIDKDVPLQVESTDENGETHRVTLTYNKNGENKQVCLRTAYNGVTIQNIIRPIKTADKVYERLTKYAGVSPTKAARLASYFGYNGGENTKVDDAQSYITFPEACRRIAQLGLWDEYKELIRQLDDPNIPVKDIDFTKFGNFIQVLKNYYYNQHFNNRFKRHVPVQIKNAEFIIVPKLIAGTQLEDLHQWMLDNDIDQLNTLETSKASNANYLNLRDENDDLIDLRSQEVTDWLSRPDSITTYSYNYLYRQQAVVSHLVDRTNKAGIQIMKKILDNCDNSLKQHKDNFIAAYVANIKESFQSLWDEFNITFDENFNINNSEDSIDWTKFNERAIEECQRLGLDDNAIDSFTTTGDKGETLMPTCMSINSNKLESVALSIVTNAITRQTLKGAHLTQITDVGLRPRKLKYISNDDIVYSGDDAKLYGYDKELRYYPDAEHPYVEVKLPKWTAALLGVNIDDIVNNDDICKFIGYRIPTEGKQSTAILKVVGFLPEGYDSTIAVPDGWVAQTGSDFDVDSIYTIMPHIYKDRHGRIKQVNSNIQPDEDNTWLRYANYVNANIDRQIKRLNEVSLTSEEKELAIKRVNKLNNDLFREAYEQVKEANVELFARENEIYHELSKFDGIKDSIDAILKDRNTPFTKRCQDLINWLREDKSLDNLIEESDEFVDLIDEYEKIYKNIKSSFESIRESLTGQFADYSEELRSAGASKYKKGIRDRAEAGGLMTFEEFKKLTPIEQLTKEGRENLLIKSAISMLESHTNAEETLMRSQFDTLIKAKNDIDAKKGLNKVYHSPYMFEDKIYYRNNSMSGAQLKGMSVFLDNFSSIANQAHAKFDSPITFTIKKTEDINIEEIKKAYDDVKDDGDYITVTSSNIGWSKNDRNFNGDLITVSASETTAHILDAVKEGAVENENMFTFAPFKMLLMMGLDHYTAQLWLRQPAIMEVGNVFNATQSSFVKYNANPINIAIRNIAKKFKTKDGKFATGTTHPVDNGTEIDTIINTLDTYFAPAGKKSTNLRRIANSIKIDARVIDELYNPIDETNQDEVNKRVKDEILQLLMFKNIKAMANKVTQYQSILSVDKYGAKSSFYDARSVFRNIYDIFNNDNDYSLVAQNDTNTEEVNLLESIFPGISNIVIKGEFESTNGVFESREFYDIDNGIKQFLKANRGRTSSYPIINAHMIYGLAPAYLVLRKKFETESPAFIEAVTYLEEALGSKIDANTYNQFKKYLLNNAYRRVANLARSLQIDDEGNIDYIYDEQGRAIAENVARVYGYTTGRNPIIDFEDVNNPTEEEYNKFLALSPAGKLLTIQKYINSDKPTIFDFLKANMFHAKEVKNKGISGQSIRFDDQNNNIDYIHKLFEEAINNENKLVRTTAIDLLKYAFYVEGYSYGRGKVSKTINNASLYGGSDVGGLNVVSGIVKNVEDINKKFVVDEHLVDDFIKGHPDIKNIPTYKYRDEPIQEYENTDLKTFYFDFINHKADKNKAYKMQVCRESFSSFPIANGYFKVVKGNDEIIYKTKPIGFGKAIVGVWCYPLNKLEPYEYKVSSVKDYNRFPPESFYSEYYTARFINEKDNIDAAFYTKYRELARIEIQGLKDSVPTPVEDNGVSLTYLADNISNDSINTFVRKIEEGFAEIDRTKSKKVLVNIWQVSPELAKTFYKLNDVYHQVIDTPDGERRIYKISRKRVDVEKQVAKKGHNEIYDTLKENGVKYSEEVYVVRRAKVVFNENELERDSAINIDDIEVDNPNVLSDLGKINKQMYENLDIDAKQHKDQDALKTLRRLKSNGIDFDYVEGIENNLETSTNILVNYFANKAVRLKSKINQFTQDDDGNWVSINDKYVLDRLMSGDEDFRNMFLETFLECATFGDRFEDLRYLSTDNLSDTTKRNINSILNSINEIRNSSAVYNAIKSYIDRYIASKSLNRYIKDGTFKMSEWITTDMTSLGKMFLDVNEIADPLIQNILKMTNVDMMEGRMASEDNVEAFNNAWQKIVDDAAAAGVNIDMTKVVNPDTGTIKEDYTDDFLKDKKAQEDAYNKARTIYKPFDKEYILARRKYDIWKYENLEQRYVSDYYKERLDNEATMLAPENFDTYCEYLRLKEQLRSLYNMEKTKAVMNEIHDANRKLRQLSSTRTVDGAKKVGTGLRVANALRNFIRKEEQINKKYNEETPIHEFEELRDKYLDTIHRITYPNGSIIPIPVSDREKNPEYVEAMTWLKENTVRRLPKEFSEQLNNAFEELRGEKGRNAAAMYGIIDEHPDVDFYDANGIIDGRKFTPTEVAVIKQNQEYTNEGTDGEIRLIRNKVEDDYVYTREFYNGLKSKNAKKDEERNEIISQINEILETVVSSSGKVCVSYLNIEQLTKLDELYTKLATHDTIYRETDEEVAEFIRDNVAFREDKVFIKFDKDNAIEERKKLEKKDADDYWELYNRVTSNYEMKKLKNGAYAIKINKKKANRYLFTYVVPKRGTQSRFIDPKRTKAKSFLKDNINFTVTDYYLSEKERARKEGRLDEWIRDNHVWNPYTQELEPLRIWTTMETKSDSTYKYEYVPNYLTKDRNIKEEYQNPNYKDYGANWNGKNYKESSPANKYEKQLRDLMLDSINQLAYNDAGRRYYQKRIVPFKKMSDKGIIDFGKRFAHFVGIDTSVDSNRGQSDDIGYAFDRDSIINSMEKVHIQGERKEQKIPKRLENETNEEYQERIKDILEYNKEVREYNDELKRKYASKDYKGLFQEFIRTATINQYLDNSKNHLYMVLEWYRKYKEGYDTNFLGNLKINHRLSTKDHREYKRKKLDNDLALIENYIRRIYKNQFRPYGGKWDEAAALFQRMTSAKYMMLNLTGGVSNILTGRGNIAMEAWANQYFSNGDWMAARARYFTHIFDYILGSFSDKSTCLEDGLFKLFNIIDFDRIKEGAKSLDDADAFWKKLTNFAYSPQTAGEHYMQNGALLVMLMNHHVLEVNGKCRIIDKGYARYEAEYEALYDVVENNPNVKPIYDNFIKRINQDAATAREYQTYRRNIVEDFFALFRNSENKDVYDKLVSEYVQYRKEFINKFMEQFDKSKRLIDYFELVNGRAKLKEDNNLTLRDLAEFGNKVQNVNKYIHGVYDKYGAAYIESAYPIGGLIMQFHKHIPNGIMKYFRANGYFNENTGLPRKGIVRSIGHLLSREYIKQIDAIKTKYANGAQDMPITDKMLIWLDVFLRGSINTIREFNTNYQLMSEVDRANIRRALSNLAYTSYMGILAIIAACILYEDDDSLLGNWMLYSADRTASEVNSFTFGAINEIKKMSNNPVAFMSSLNDVNNITGMFVSMLINPDDYDAYYHGGQYSGENKMAVMALRQIPIYRSIDRVRNLDRNNRYYKLGDNVLSLLDVNSIAEWILK